MPPVILSRIEAIQRLETLKGVNLQPLAAKYGVTIASALTGGVNKGWPGHVCEQFLGLKANSSKEPDFIEPITNLPWELKATPYKLVRKRGARIITLEPKETMQITMINPKTLVATDFYDSGLWHKIKSMVVVSWQYVEGDPVTSPLLAAATFDMEGHEMLEQIKADYDLTRAKVAQYADPDEGLDHLSGHMGVFVQPRTKGKGGPGKKTRAFYFRPIAIKKLFEVKLDSSS